MRLGVWLLLPLSFSGCSGGYPLEPTPCDELCHLTRDRACSGDYAPAGCVVSCERSLDLFPPCQPLLDPLLSCYRSTPDLSAKLCDYSTRPDQRPCYPEQQALEICVSYGFMLPPGAP